MAYHYDALVGEYARRWSAMEIGPGTKALAAQVAKRLHSHMERYRAVSNATGVPPAVIACIHERESGGDFKTYLGNGEPLTRTTRLVPKGRGPFASWEDGAIDALTMRHMERIKGWTIERAAYELEGYNGWGYRGRGLPSAYLWAGSNQYQGGKYVADGVFDRSAQDKQLGALVVLECLMERDPSLALKRDTRDPGKIPPPPDIPKPASSPPKPAANHVQAGAAAASGGLLAGLATGNPWIVVLAVIVLCGAVYLINHLRKG